MPSSVSSDRRLTDSVHLGRSQPIRALKVVGQAKAPRRLCLGMLLQLGASNHRGDGRAGDKVVAERAEQDTFDVAATARSDDDHDWVDNVDLQNQY